MFEPSGALPISTTFAPRAVNISPAVAEAQPFAQSTATLSPLRSASAISLI